MITSFCRKKRDQPVSLYRSRGPAAAGGPCHDGRARCSKHIGRNGTLLSSRPFPPCLLDLLVLLRPCPARGDGNLLHRDLWRAIHVKQAVGFLVRVGKLRVAPPAEQ